MIVAVRSGAPGKSKDSAVLSPLHCRQTPLVVGNASDATDAAWDAGLLAVGGHVLQSSAWLHVQRALGYAVLQARGDGWQWAGAIRPGRFPRYLYTPYGPASRVRTAAALQAVADAAAAAGLDLVRVEPTGEDASGALRALRARPSRSIQPRHTWVLDIGADVDVLRRGLEAGHRSRINAAGRRGLTIQVTSDPASVDVFLDLQRLAAHRTGYRGQTPRYHRTVARELMPRGVARMYIAQAAGRPVAASMTFDFGDTRYYAYSASDPDLGRRLGAGPPLLWRMILDARDRGATLFDFWGVLPESRPGHPWDGFSRFKKAFGGRLVEHAGTWDLPLRPLRTFLYRSLRARR